MNWFKDLTGKIKFDESLSKHTTFRIGGAARFFFQPKDIEDLKQLVIKSKIENMRILIIGAGSNLLVNDKGVGGIVVKLNARPFKNINSSPGLVKVGAGLSLPRLIQYALDRNLSGCEFLAGIPGTIGGALIMNAGIIEQTRNKKLKNKSLSDLVKDVTVMDYNGNIKLLSKKNIRFAYRASSLYNYIVLSASLKLSKRKRREIRNNLKRYLKLRKGSQDYSYPNAGCIFKNPAGLSSGKLIDMCGLKGKRFGDVSISSKHANFIINKGKAKSKDVLRLMDYVKQAVMDKFGIELEPEIKIWQN